MADDERRAEIEAVARAICPVLHEDDADEMDEAREYAKIAIAALDRVRDARGDDEAARLVQECDKYGLPHSLDVLLRHIYNNHAATLGAKDRLILSLRERFAARSPQGEDHETGETDDERRP